MTFLDLQHATARTHQARPQSVRQRSARHSGHGILGRIASTLSEWGRRERERAQLAALDCHTLRDIGLTRLDVAAEVDKPFWRA